VFTDLIENSGYIKNLNMIQLQSIKQGKHDLIQIKGTIVNKPAMILVDGASMHNLISQQFIDRYQLHSYLTKDKGVIEMGDGSTIDSSSYGEFAYSINAFSSKAIFYIGPLSNQNDTILHQQIFHICFRSIEPDRQESMVIVIFILILLIFGSRRYVKKSRCCIL
jgi:hypothetical protein